MTNNKVNTQNNNIIMDKMANETKEASAWDDFINWYKGFDDVKAARIRQRTKENLEKALKELHIKSL